MNYLYDLKDGNVIRVFRSGEESTKVSVYTDSKDIDVPIKEDSQGKYFTYNGENIYLNNYKKISIDSIKAKLENGEFVTSDELCQAILTEGVNSVRFILPFRIIDHSIRMDNVQIVTYNREKFIEKSCHIVEEWNRNVENKYKFKLYVDDYDGSTPQYDDVYVSDLVQMLRSGHAKIK